MVACPPSVDAVHITDAIHEMRVGVTLCISTLDKHIAGKFEQHDTDLRAEVEKVNRNVERLIEVLEPLAAFASMLRVEQDRQDRAREGSES